MSTYELSWPTFVTKETIHIIEACLCLKSEKRPSMNEVYSRLHSITEGSTETFIAPYPNITAVHLKPLSTERKGIPRVNNQREKRHHYSIRYAISKNRKHYLKENLNLFRSRMYHVPSKLRQSVKSGSLDHVVPFVRFVTRDHRKYCLEVRIPFHLSENIIEMIRIKKVGYPDANFNDLIVQVANIVKSLHESNLVLCEIRPDQFYIEELSNGHNYKIKVHLTSMPFLTIVSANDIQTEREVNINASRISFAPEIRERKMFTPAGDVYSFGFLLWDLWHARIDSRNNVTQDDYERTEFSNTADLILLINTEKLIKPSAMSNEFFDFLMKCLHKDMNQRPSMDDIISKFSAQSNYGGNSESRNTSHNGVYDYPYLSASVTTAGLSVINISVTESNTITKAGHSVNDVDRSVPVPPGSRHDDMPSTYESGYTSSDNSVYHSEVNVLPINDMLLPGYVSSGIDHHERNRSAENISTSVQTENKFL